MHEQIEDMIVVHPPAMLIALQSIWLGWYEVLTFLNLWMDHRMEQKFNYSPV